MRTLNRVTKILVFSLGYFLLYSAAFTYHTIHTFVTMQPDEWAWYLQHPVEACFVFVVALGRNPLLLLSVLQMAGLALVLGFVTESSFRFLRRCFNFSFERNRANHLGLVVSLTTVALLLLPWWSIRAIGVSIDIYPFGVMAWKVLTYDADWVVDHLLASSGAFLLVGALLAASVVFALVGSLKIPLFLSGSFVANTLAALIFYSILRSAIGRLAHGYFSGTNLIPEGPWGLTLGFGIAFLTGLASLYALLLSYLNVRKP